jgi:hypothetical protein
MQSGRSAAVYTVTMYTVVVWIEVGRSKFSYDSCRTQMSDVVLTYVYFPKCLLVELSCHEVDWHLNRDMYIFNTKSLPIRLLYTPIAHPTGGHHSGYTGAAIRLDAKGHTYVVYC